MDDVEACLLAVQQALEKVAKIDLRPPGVGAKIGTVIVVLHEGKGDKLTPEQAKLAPTALDAIAAISQVPAEARDVLRAAFGLTADHRALYDTIAPIFLD
jgi:hypothetical protein